MIVIYIVDKLAPNVYFGIVLATQPSLAQQYQRRTRPCIDLPPPYETEWAKTYTSSPTATGAEQQNAEELRRHLSGAAYISGQTRRGLGRNKTPDSTSNVNAVSDRQHCEADAALPTFDMAVRELNVAQLQLFYENTMNNYIVDNIYDTNNNNNINTILNLEGFSNTEEACTKL